MLRVAPRGVAGRGEERGQGAMCNEYIAMPTNAPTIRGLYIGAK